MNVQNLLSVCQQSIHLLQQSNSCPRLAMNGPLNNILWDIKILFREELKTNNPKLRHIVQTVTSSKETFSNHEIQIKGHGGNLYTPFQVAASSPALFVWMFHWRKNAFEYLEESTTPQLQQPRSHWRNPYIEFNYKVVCEQFRLFVLWLVKTNDTQYLVTDLQYPSLYSTGGANMNLPFSKLQLKRTF